MKFFIVTCLKEYHDDVLKIFKNADINVFSAIDIVGFKEGQTANLLAEWFARGGEQFDSLMLFSFAPDENAETGVELIKKYNEENGHSFPIRGFIMPVDKSSY